MSGALLARAARLLLAGVTLAAVDPGGAARARDPRLVEVLEHRCVSDVAERALTLFGNGTVRLVERRRVAGASSELVGSLAPRSAEENGGGAAAEVEQRMYLAELDTEELAAYRARLAAIDLDEAESRRDGPVGAWVEQCELRLELGAGASRAYRYGRLDSLQLGVSNLLAIALELAEEARARDPGSGFPPRYVPRPGDVVERADGSRFEVLRETDDGRGFELQGVDQPLVLYVPREAIRERFESLVERRP